MLDALTLTVALLAPPSETPLADAIRSQSVEVAPAQPASMPKRDKIYVAGMVWNVTIMAADVDSSSRCFEHNVTTGRRVCRERIWPHSAFQDSKYFGLVAGAVDASALYMAHRLHRSGEERQASGEPERNWRWRKLVANVWLCAWAATRTATVANNWRVLERVRSRGD